jgi:hypothetical protein
MAHRLEDEAGVTRALAIGIRMTPAEIAKGRYMRAPDHEPSRGEAMDAALESIVEDHLGGADDADDEKNEDQPADDQSDDDADDGEKPDSDDDQGDNADEAQPEPIKPPVSWDADAKELFEQLPPDLQTKVVEREAQREKLIQQRTTEAAEAKRNAAAEANIVVADKARQFASHLEQIAANFAPQAPDPAIAAQDPGLYIQLRAQFDADTAQHQKWLQQSEAARGEADQRENFARQEELRKDHVLLSAELGDAWTDTTKRKELLTSLETVGAELGYPVDLMGQANATDILALKAASEWKAKADKYDKLQSNKPNAVRAAQTAPRVAKPGVSATSAEKSARGRDAAWQRAKTERSGDAYAAVLDSMGINL